MGGQDVAVQQSFLQLACVYVGAMLCGFDIRYVQEIKKYSEVTPVPLSPPYIRGIMNLRGQIVTLVDLGVKLDIPMQENGQQKIVIVNWDSEYIGFLVDNIRDVLTVQQGNILPPPSNIKGTQGKYFRGIYHFGKELVGIIDIDAVLH